VTLLALTSRRALLVFGTVVAACAIAACGSSKSSTSTSASASTTAASSSRATLVACLKAHGVTLPAGASGVGRGTNGGPPRGAPGAGGGGALFGGGAGGAGRFRGNSKFAAAFKACGANFRGRFRPGAGRGGFRISHTAINNFVACVRKHGYPQMPNANFSGKGGVFPSSIRTNPKFVAASRVCASTLRPSGAPSGSAGSSTSS
jgi:hypothetical protein